MKKIIIAVSTIIVLLIMVAAMAGLFSDKTQPGLQSNNKQLNTQSGYSVKVQLSTVYEAVPASVIAQQSTLVSSRIIARIKSIAVRAGDTVTKGQTLLQLEQNDLNAKVSQAQAQIKATLAHANEAKKQLQRSQELIKKGVIAAADLDQAKARSEGLKADVERAKQALAEAQTAATYATIKAPIAGRIVDRLAEPGDTAQPGVALLSIYNPQTLQIEAHVREQLALRLKMDTPLQVYVPSTDQHFDAIIEERIPAGNAGSRSFLIKARLNREAELLPGMYARLIIPSTEQQQINIPKALVVEVGQLNVVWVLNNHQIERRFIRTGPVNKSGEIQVIAGLVDGEILMPPPAEKP